MAIIGPELDREQLPRKMAKYCDPEFKIFAMKQVPMNSNNVRKTSNASEVVLNDPLFKKEVNYGDAVPDFSDLFDVLPPSTRSSRVKRECRTPDMVIQSCWWRQVQICACIF